MKDLVYHRTLLPAAERYANNLASVDGDFTSTYAEHTDRVLRLDTPCTMSSASIRATASR